MITPKILKGTSDYGAEEMAKRNHVVAVFRQIFEKYGYDTLETPVIEYAETILGKYGEEGDKLTYHFKDHGDRHIALRYDQTVPFARYFAANWQELPRPFKRYQISRVWRADKPQKGRKREFYQCDIDIIGSESLMTELELVQVMQEAFTTLKLDDFIITFNDRRFINSALAAAQISDCSRLDAIRIIDKYDKIGPENVEKELLKAGIQEESAKKLLELIDVETGDNRMLIEKYEAAGLEVSAIAELVELAEAVGINKTLQFNPRLARGLDYYTGIIFEVILTEAMDLGSVCGGGRYDDLCGSFCKDSFSGVGVAFGFARIMEALMDRSLLKHIKLATDVLVINFSEEMQQNQLKMAHKLRQAGINTETYFEPDKLAKQFKYADKKSIRYVLVQGPDEAQKEVVQLKNMQTGEQHEVELDQAISLIKETLMQD